MKLIEKQDFAELVGIVPLGDIHLGSQQLDMENLKYTINFIKNHKHSYVIIIGDVFDTALIDSKTPPFTQNMSMNEAINQLKELLSPIKHRILGVITGNHENRLVKSANLDPLQAFCDLLEIPFLGYSGVFRLRIGKHVNRKLNLISPNINYIVFAHHTRGGGEKIGSKIQRVIDLQDVFIGADIYIGGHNHEIAHVPQRKYYLSVQGNGEASIREKIIYYVDSGSYVKYEGSYAEEKGKKPTVLGSPLILLNGNKREITIFDNIKSSVIPEF